MKTQAQRMNALLKVREAELEAAVSRLLEKRTGLLEGLAKLKTLESEKKKASSEIYENAEWNLKRRGLLPKAMKMQNVMTPYYTEDSWQDCAEKHCD